MATWNVPLQLNNLQAEISNQQAIGLTNPLNQNVQGNGKYIAGCYAPPFGTSAIICAGTDTFLIEDTANNPLLVVSNTGLVLGGVGGNPVSVEAPTVSPSSTSDDRVATTAFVQSVVGSAVQSVSAGTNISVSGTTQNPTVNLQAPLTSQLNCGTQQIIGQSGTDQFSLDVGGLTVQTSDRTNQLTAGTINLSQPTSNFYLNLDNAYSNGIPTIELFDNNINNNVIISSSAINQVTGGNQTFNLTGSTMSVPTGLSINSNNNTIDINSGSGDTYIGDTASVISNVYLRTDANGNQLIGNCSGFTQIGDINGSTSGMTITLNQNTPVLQLLGNGHPIQAQSGSGVISLGDPDGSANQTLLKIDDLAQTISCDIRSGNFSAGDITNAVNGTKIVADANANGITLYSTGFVIADTSQGNFSAGDINAIGNGTNIQIVDSSQLLYLNSGGNIQANSNGGTFSAGDTAGANNLTLIKADDVARVITLDGYNGTVINKGGVQQKTAYKTTAYNPVFGTDYQLTYNGSNLTITLPAVSAGSTGWSFNITNVNATALTVNSSSSQLIYSSTGVASATSRSLATGHSFLFTSIQSGSSTYAWSMV